METKKSKQIVENAENQFRATIIEQMNVLGDMILGKNDEKGFKILLKKPIAISVSNTSDNGIVTTTTTFVEEVYRIRHKWHIYTSVGKEEYTWDFHMLDLNSMYQLYCALEQTVKCE